MIQQKPGKAKQHTYKEQTWRFFHIIFCPETFPIGSCKSRDLRTQGWKEQQQQQPFLQHCFIPLIAKFCPNEKDFNQQFFSGTILNLLIRFFFVHFCRSVTSWKIFVERFNRDFFRQDGKRKLRWKLFVCMTFRRRDRFFNGVKKERFNHLRTVVCKCIDYKHSGSAGQ